VARLVLALAVVLASASIPAGAQSTNSNINYLGRLTDDFGDPVTTATTFVFKICNGGFEFDPVDCGGGTSVWTETRTETPSATGQVDLLLGKVTGLDFTLFNTPSPLFLQVSVGGEILLPRTKLSLAQAESVTNSGNYYMESVTSAAAKGVVVASGRSLFGGRMGVGTLEPTSQLEMKGALIVGQGITVGIQPVIDPTGKWVGKPIAGTPGPQGPAGPAGPPGPAVTTVAVCGTSSCQSACPGGVAAEMSGTQGCTVAADAGTCSMRALPQTAYCCACKPQ
jgi:hypothetical protein